MIKKSAPICVVPQHGEQLILSYNIPIQYINVYYIRVVQMDIILAAALHVMRRSRTSEKAKKLSVRARGVVAYHKSEGRVGE